MTDVVAADERYAGLCDHARRVAFALLRQPGDEAATASCARYLLRTSACLAASHVDTGYPRPAGPAADALDAVAAKWPAVRDGVISGEQLFEGQPGLWARLMDEWPMGWYAQLAVEALLAQNAELSCVLELGAGVGATTRRLRRATPGTAIVATDLRYGPSGAVDFDQPILPQVLELGQVDTVVATNALHCAADPLATLHWIREVLRPGGLLIIAEGAPFPEPGVPWALNLAFGACAGWHDRRGFAEPEFWAGALAAAGYALADRVRYPSVKYELGGCFVARH